MTTERDNKGGRTFRDVFSKHFHITTSGFRSDPALLLRVREPGVDHGATG